MTLSEYQKQFRKDLLNSIQDKDIKKAKILLKAGNSLDFFIDDKTPLMHACSYSKHIALNMLQHGANPKIVNSEGKTALFYACSQGDYEIVKRLFELDAFNVVKDKFSNHILHVAANSSSRQVIEFLLNLNFDPNVRDYNGKTPLHYAVWHGYDEVSELLIKRGALVNLLDDKRNPPILYTDKLSTIKLLLDHNSNVLSNGRETLIHKLIEKNKIEEIKYLHYRLKTFDKTLGPNLCNPLIFAVFNDNYTLTKFFIENKYDVNISNEMGLTPLMRAVEKKNFSIVKLLVENNANAFAKNKKGETPFLIACKHDDLKSAKFLYTYDQCVNQQDDLGYTPLMWAISYKYDKICDFLIENGAEPTIQNIYKKDAIRLAQESNNKYFEKFKV